MTTDLIFFTNKPDATLLDRFKATLRDVRFFDAQVGFFRTSDSCFLSDNSPHGIWGSVDKNVVAP